MNNAPNEPTPLPNILVLKEKGEIGCYFDSWIVANSIGWAVALLAYYRFSEFPIYGGFESQWRWVVLMAIPVPIVQWLIMRRWVNKSHLYLLINLLAGLLGVFAGNQFAYSQAVGVMNEYQGLVWSFYFGPAWAIISNAIQLIYWRSISPLAYLVLPINVVILIIAYIITSVTLTSVQGSNSIFLLILAGLIPGAIYGWLSGFLFRGLIQDSLVK